MITGNTAECDGGVYILYSGTFDRRGGVISDNTVIAEWGIDDVRESYVGAERNPNSTDEQNSDDFSLIQAVIISIWVLL